MPLKVNKYSCLKRSFMTSSTKIQVLGLYVVSMHNVPKIQLFDSETKEEGWGFIIIRYNRSSQVALASHPQNATPHLQKVTFSFLSRPGSCCHAGHLLPHPSTQAPRLLPFLRPSPLPPTESQYTHIMIILKKEFFQCYLKT